MLESTFLNLHMLEQFLKIMHIIFSYSEFSWGIHVDTILDINEVHAKAERSVPTCHKNSSLHSLFSTNSPLPPTPNKKGFVPTEKERGYNNIMQDVEWIVIYRSKLSY